MDSNLGNLVGVTTRHDRGLVEIPGAEEANWGTGAAEQNSVVGALSAICKLLHFNGVDYVAMMGVSAHAFRIQVSAGKLSASSPNAMSGRRTGPMAFEAVPLEWDTVEAGQPGTHVAEVATDRVKASIDLGLPVLAMGDETDLVTGHFFDHLVGRMADAHDEGYCAIHRWPDSFLIPVRRRAVAPPIQQVKAGLAAAVESWHSEEVFEGYFDGEVAYEAWSKQLEESHIRELSADDLWRHQHANSYIVECLVDARYTASKFLTRVSNALGPVAKVELLAAAQVYQRMLDEVLRVEGEPYLAPPTWASNAENPWSQAQREFQIERLAQARKLDAEAILHLEKALEPH